MFFVILLISYFCLYVYDLILCLRHEIVLYLLARVNSFTVTKNKKKYTNKEPGKSFTATPLPVAHIYAAKKKLIAGDRGCVCLKRRGVLAN